ncbi:MAG: hypothetical protein BGO31_20715 [Bacteroidetes bacterium 43-16]|uniref:hypothetical protein n=1 Tax=uncultured Dysgonomonas sp. TaxID=206096 RepID=UPI00092A9D9E|nr:hypothetical protein [uncultured Dysgonomonas sp.]OJV55354.1 MAG: hypothetical protein BGO31_20715 [Bacteroidetes bacterium 43-16]
MKITILLLILFGLYPGKGVAQSRNSDPVAVRRADTAIYYKPVFHKGKDLRNRVHVFEFPDRVVSLAYDTTTWLGLSVNNGFDLYRADFDLDLGEVECYWFEHGAEQVIVIALREDREVIYNLFQLQADSVYYMGSTEMTLPQGQETQKLNFSREPNAIFIALSDDKNMPLVSASLSTDKLLLKPIKHFPDLNTYTGSVK